MMHTNLHVRTQNKHQLIIAAVSSRPYVKAAVEAGFEVIAIDAFADIDTQELAYKVYQVAANDGQFDRQSILGALNAIDMSACIGFCYGAGFEAIPDILVEISKLMHVFGNSAESVKRSKKPSYFFEQCTELNMLYPEVRFEPSNLSENWLIKSIGASGGGHIQQFFLPDIASLDDVYYQKKQEGMPVSCLFVADGKNAKSIGYSEQWCSATNGFPYRYGGAVGHIEISDTCKKIIDDFIDGITFRLGLLGINSADFIIQNDQVFALEINPRLSATLDLYRMRGGLFKKHLQPSLDDWQCSDVDKNVVAHQIIYAQQETSIPINVKWPIWVHDIPPAGSMIEVGMPICTVVAEAENAELAKEMLKERAIDCVNRLC